MKQLPTAEAFIEKYRKIKLSGEEYKAKDILIEFAKLHVQAALERAAEKAYFRDFNDYICHSEENKKSILNAYPLDNIK